MSHDIRRKIYRSYPHLLADIQSYGHLVEGTRISPTKELRGATFVLTPGDMVKRPGFSKKLGWLELLHLLAGTFDQAHFKLVAPKIKEGFFTANMAYGPRVQPHLDKLSKMLIDDPFTRRAEVLIANNNFDNAGFPPPCTTSIHFLIRNERLLTFVEMRSWDAWLGLPYDIIMFGGLALAMADVVDCPVGPLEVHASSLHLYERQFNIDPATAFNVPNSFSVDVGYALESQEQSLKGREHEEYPGVWDGIKAQAEADLAWLPWYTHVPMLITHQLPGDM